MDKTPRGADAELLARFERDVLSKVPHADGGVIAGATPLVDLTQDLVECAKSVFKTDLGGADLRVYGKFDSVLPGGSIKTRAAVHIIHDAIASGRLRGGQTVIEATSGNFGIALGQLAGLGVTVIALVSRRLQEGVFKELRDGGIRIMDLDMDICPAPGMEDKADGLAARAAAANIRSQLSEMGFDQGVFDANLAEIEALLAKQDIINLAGFLAGIYGLFCTAQYDNALNIEAHRVVTAPEIDQQIRAAGAGRGGEGGGGGGGDSLEHYQLVCAFGTGGTSGGLSRYMSEKYEKRPVHVVFPAAGQDVAGIRTLAKADGLRLYDPSAYAAQHEVDYEKAKYLLKFFVQRGRDIGESTALALYAVMEMAAQGRSSRFVVMVADGIAKYKKNLEQVSLDRMDVPIGVELADAAASAGEYDRVVWVHTQYAPKDEGLDIIARSLGVDRSKITVPAAGSVSRMLSTGEIPGEIAKELGGGGGGKTLLVCMAGNTSMAAARVMAGKGVSVQSLNGGITGLPEGMMKNPGEYIRAAGQP